MLFEQILPSGATLHPGDSVISPNHQYAMILQNNGNLVHVLLGPPQQVIWASNTSGHQGNSCKMQQDGNLVVYSSSNHALWASHTRGRNAHLSVNDNGSAYIIASSGQKVGASFLEHLILWTNVSSTPSEEGDSTPPGGN